MDAYSEEELEKLGAGLTKRKLVCRLCAKLFAQEGGAEERQKPLSRASYEQLEGFHLHLREHDYRRGQEAEAEAARASQQRRSVLLSAALKGQVLFYEVVDGKLAAFPKAPRLLQGGALVRPRFFEAATQRVAQEEGFSEVLFEYWESEVAALNCHLLLHTSMLSPRHHFYQRVSPYALGGPHRLMDAASLFWSMVVQWLASGQKAVFPVQTRDRKLAQALLLASWKQFNTHWTGIFQRAAKSPHSVLCQWLNDPHQAMASFPVKKGATDRPHSYGCLSADSGCPFFHQPLTAASKSPAKAVGREMLSYESDSDDSCTTDEDAEASDSNDDDEE
ncbi:MAG: hypothetical protein Q8P67_10260 [archaeon]|nr:hypothetical protein [archaeon]